MVKIFERKKKKKKKKKKWGNMYKESKGETNKNTRSDVFT